MRIEYYKAETVRGARWFWRLRASNGKIIADGAESYANKGNVLRALNKLRNEHRRLATAEISEGKL